MGINNKEIAELKRRCPELIIDNRPIGKVKRKRKPAKPGESDDSLPGMRTGRNVIYRGTEFVFKTKAGG